MDPTSTFTAFNHHRLLAAGDLLTVAQAVATHDGQALILDDASGRPVDLDLRHGPEEAVAEHFRRVDGAGDPEAPAPRTRGRPRLGVVAREVTLLPRHWDWLAAQPGGASAALRRLVEDARHAAAGADRHRVARDALYRAMAALAGDLPRFEDAARALFAPSDRTFDAIIASWPADIAGYLARLAEMERSTRSAA